ncbi:urease accessory protein UreD [Paenibacillus kobensis]|uniref:urease accessory protein UreD n=1 Tax=Paenibacillus kobensis TaxID=59841 RepID=UPI0013E2F2BC|nr:urease accessory protein UreD [Paenibacillus kobensis]
MTTSIRINQSAAGATAQLRAAFERRGGVTVMTEKYQTAPVKIAKTFPLGSSLGAIVMDVSPGLLDGDRYELEWKCGPGSRLFVTNQSFTKVHPAGPQGGASMKQTFVLEADAVIEHMPEPVMLYKDAEFVSETEVHLASGAVWMQADVWCPGRTLRGERFQYTRFDSRLAVWYGDERIGSQRQLIEPAVQVIAAPGCFADATHIGSLLVYGDRIGAAELAAAREALQLVPHRSGYGLTFGASLTYRHGLAVMAAGTAAWPLQEALREAWRAVRLSLLGEEPVMLVRA